MNPTTKTQLTQALTRPLIQYLLLFLAVMCVYLPTMWYTFIWDDFAMIGHNKSIREWDMIPQYFTDPSTFVDSNPNEVSLLSWRPIRNIYFLLTYKLHDLRPAGWHLQQVLLHSLCTMLLLGFFSRVYQYASGMKTNLALSAPVQIAAWMVAFAWAVHPANTEVLGWMKAADDIIACVFGLSVLILLIPHNGKPSAGKIALAALLYPIGLLTKESLPPLAVIYPMIIIVLAPSLKTAIKNRPAIIATAILAIQTLVFIIVRDRILGKSSQGDYLAENFSLMMATMTTAVVRYLQLTFWPFWPTTQLGSYLTWPIADSWADPYVLSSCAFIVFCALLCAYVSRRSRIFLAGCLFAVLAFLPTANILPMVQVLAERFMYFPLMGVALATFPILVTWLSHNTFKRIWLPVTFCAALVATTELRLPVWIDELTFQKELYRANPSDYRAVRNIGATLFTAGQTTASLPYYIKSMELRPVDGPEFLKKSFDYSTKQVSLTVARIYANQKNFSDSLAYVQKAFSLFPPTPMELAFKADILRMDGQTSVALATYEAAAKAGYESPNFHVLLSEVEKQSDNETSAAVELQKAFKTEPRPKARSNPETSE